MPQEDGAPDLLERLLVECLELAERDGPAAIEAFCQNHLEHADALRSELRMLAGLGLFDASAKSRGELPAESIGGFRLIRRLGEGGMGVVYLAEQTALKRLVALKVLRAGPFASAGVATRFHREALTVARLRHEGIVTLYATGEDGGVRYLAMELVPGRGLDEILAEATLSREAVPIPSLIRWGRDIARALACAHAAGVVHRDVKPSNVRITPEGRAMLLDFGLARDLEEPGLTRTGEFQGSPHYASPEQVGGGKTPIGPATDIFSLGVTLYECATGRLPFAGETTEQLFRDILACAPEPPRRRNPAVPRDLDVVLLKALEKDPERRYAGAARLADDLAAILELHPIAARRPGVLVRAWKWARRNPAAAAGVSTAVLALVLVAAFLFQNARAARQRVRDDAAAAVREARSRLEAFGRSRAELGQSENRLARLQEDLGYRYLAPSEDRELDRLELQVERGLRERETTLVQILALLQQSEALDPGNPAARELRAELYAQKLEEAENARNPSLAEFYRELVLAVDPRGTLVPRVAAKGAVRFVSEPAGADVHLFRYREEAELRDGGERRLVPIPVGDPSPPLRAGAMCLRVVRGSGAIETGDLIVDLAGLPIQGTLFVGEIVSEGSSSVRVLDRLAAIDGEPVAEEFDVELLTGVGPGPAVELEEPVPPSTSVAPGKPVPPSALVAPGKPVPPSTLVAPGKPVPPSTSVAPGKPVPNWRFEFERAGTRFEVEGVSLASLGVRLLSPAAMAERGGIAATVYQGGTLSSVTLPEGLLVRATCAPLPLSPACRIGTTPTEAIELEPGSYTAVFRRAGCEDQRRPFLVFRGHESKYGVRLEPTGSTPEGFVRVVNATREPAQVPDFWLQEREVTFGEYLEFLNDPEIHREIAASSKGILVPYDKAGTHCPRQPDGSFGLSPEVGPDFPVHGVSWHDARRYAGWRSARARDAGIDFEFTLPAFEQWKVAGHGADSRIFVFGSRFRPKWMKSNYARKKVADPEPVLRFPVDESVFGAFDMSGSVLEWLEDWYREGVYRRAAGGSWGQTDPGSYFLVQGGLGAIPENVSNIIGFRLVARRTNAR